MCIVVDLYRYKLKTRYRKYCGIIILSYEHYWFE